MSKTTELQEVGRKINELCSITIPIVSGDMEGNLENFFKLWSDPRFCPLIAPRDPVQHLIIVVNNADDRQLDQIKEIYARYPVLKNAFVDMVAVSAGLLGDRDLYVRNRSDAVGKFGNKAGPNFLFEGSMHAAHKFGGFTFQLELDCIPLKAGWLPELEDIVRGHPRAWVVGTIFSGNKRLKKATQTHLNGNAIYKAGDPRFQDFVTNQWMRRILESVHENPTIAYDTWWSMEASAADPILRNESWRLFQKYDSFFQNDPFIMNFLDGSSEIYAACIRFQELKDLNRTPIFLHSPFVRKIIPFILKNPDLELLAAMEALAVDPSQHREICDFLMTMQGNSCLAAAATQLLNNPLVMIALLDDDPKLAKHIAKNLASNTVSSDLKYHYQRVLNFAKVRGGNPPHV